LELQVSCICFHNHTFFLWNFY